jgi:uncharacterized protein (DUF433 family)
MAIHSATSTATIVSDTMQSIRALLSLRETLVLAEIADEGIVRKDIESGWLTARAISQNQRLRFRWFDVILIGAIYRNDHLPSTLRKRALETLYTFHCSDHLFFHSASSTFSENWRKANCARKIDIDNYIFIDLLKVCDDVGPRVDLYAEGLRRIEEKSAILNGTAIFRGTRLSVLHIGKMYDRGEGLENILEDYPYLTGRDVEFAQLYYRAHPPVGRPRACAEGDDAAEIDVG